MPDVSETRLPGVGVRHEFTTAAGERLGVLSHRSGRRELMLYDRSDPDRCTTVLHLDPDDARTLAELLGASPVSAALADVEHRVEGLVIDWLTVPSGSSLAGTTVGQSEIRSRTGASVVAAISGDTTAVAPGPDFTIADGDVLVVVGTQTGLEEVRRLLRS